MSEYAISDVQWLQTWADVAIKSATLDEALDFWTDRDAAADDLIALLYRFYEPAEGSEVSAVPEWHRDLLDLAWETVKEWLIVRAAAVTGTINDVVVRELLYERRNMRAEPATADQVRQQAEGEKYRRARAMIDEGLTRRQHELSRAKAPSRRRAKRKREVPDSPDSSSSSREPIESGAAHQGLTVMSAATGVPSSSSSSVPAQRLSAGPLANDFEVSTDGSDDTHDLAEPATKRARREEPPLRPVKQTRFDRQLRLADHLQWTLNWLASGHEPAHVIGRVVPTGKNHPVTKDELEEYCRELAATMAFTRRGGSLNVEGLRIRVLEAVRRGEVVVSTNYQISRRNAARR